MGIIKCNRSEVMFRAPEGLREHESRSTLDPIFAVKSSKSSKPSKSTDKRKKTKSLEDWWYGEVNPWRLSACFVWFLLSFVIFFAIILFPFSLLSANSTILLFLCGSLILFGQQTLRSSSFLQTFIRINF